MKIHTDFSTLEKVRNPVVTIGTFDGVHMGHRSILMQLQKLAAEVDGETVLLTFYPHPRMVLHPDDHQIDLLNTPEEKAKLLEMAGIDHLMIFSFSLDFSRQSPFEYVRDLLVTGLHAHTVVVGYDHRFGRNREGNHQTLLELSEIFGFKVQEIPAKEIDHVNVSSTKIRTALKQGEVKEATQYLGYNYRISGTVVAGNRLGRALGYPTANISPDYAYKLIPGNGIYAVIAHLHGRALNAVMSIGVRPTVTDSNLQTIEVYIIDFDGDIYGEKIQIEIVEYIRPELKFGSIDELKQHIALDIETAQKYF